MVSNTCNPRTLLINGMGDVGRYGNIHRERHKIICNAEMAYSSSVVPAKSLGTVIPFCVTYFCKDLGRSKNSLLSAVSSKELILVEFLSPAFGSEGKKKEIQKRKS